MTLETAPLRGITLDELIVQIEEAKAHIEEIARAADELVENTYRTAAEVDLYVYPNR
jgi:hypothetical protein